jgi:putative colanic acid biosynthesis UDP-glucose lipid carrier transferase
MKYSVRRLFDYWIGPVENLPGLEHGESDENSTVRTPNHDAADDPQPPTFDPANITKDAGPGFPLAVKRAFDIVVAIMGLVVFSPTFLLVSMAIKLDSRGPVFRRRRLYGYTGEETLVWSFRFNEFTTRATISSRATRIGGILRSSGVEELPQLINVLLGEMSIVGPKPLLTAPGLRLQNQFFLQRLKMRPGLISWAQVNECGREINTQEAIRRRVEYDLYYAEHWSFFLDMKIIAMNVLRNTA